MIATHVRDMFALFAVSYPSWPVFTRGEESLEQTLNVWTGMLSDLPAENVLNAARRHVAESKFAPTIAEVRALAVPPSETQQTPEEAWGDLSRERSRIGYYGKPKFANPNLARAVDAMGGWDQVNLWLTADMPAHRAHFFRIFGAYEKRTQDELSWNRAERFLPPANVPIGQSVKSIYGASYHDQVDAEPDAKTAAELTLDAWERGEIA